MPETPEIKSEMTVFFNISTHNFQDAGGVETFSRYVLKSSPPFVKVLHFSYAYPDFRKVPISPLTELFPVIMSQRKMAWTRSVTLADKVTNGGPIAGLVFVITNVSSLFFSILRQKRNIARSDALHGLGGPIEVMFTYFVFRFTGKPYVISYHTDVNAFTGNPFSRWLLGKGMREAAMIGINAQDLARTATEVLGVDPNKIFVMPQRVDTLVFNPQDINTSRSQLGWPENRKVILFAGSLGKVKFFDVALNAMRKVLEGTAGKDFLFVIAGSGLLGKEAESLQLAYPENVKYQDSVSSAKLNVMMNGADAIFGYADVEYAGQLTMEALSTGSPVLLFDRAYRQTGIEKLNFNIPVSLVYSAPAEPDGLSKFLVKEIDNIVMAKHDVRKRAEAFEYIKRNHSVEVVLDDVFTHFVEAIEREKQTGKGNVAH